MTMPRKSPSRSLKPRLIKRGFVLSVTNRAPEFRFSERRVKRVLRSLLLLAGRKQAALSVLMVNDREIRSLNRRHLGHDRPTDVIAFSQIEGKGPRVFIRGKPFLGDLVISAETAARQAVIWHTGFFYEICLYLCHGILHLLGYDDLAPRKALLMKKKQKHMMAALRGDVLPPRMRGGHFGARP